MNGERLCLRPFAGLGLSLAPVEVVAQGMMLKAARSGPQPGGASASARISRPWGYGLLLGLSRETRGR